jgi:hypothetical protein
MFMVSILMMLAAPVSADMATHILLCEQDDAVTDDQVEEIAAEWFKAAKAVKGGENLELSMMLIAPNFAEWGEFMDNYPESPAEDIDDRYENEIDCGDGALWESVKMK